jgi:integrase
MSSVKGVLSQAYRAAMSDSPRLVDFNPTLGVEVPKTKNPGRPSNAFTPEEVSKFLAAIKGTEHEAIWLTMLGVGLRPSEVRGLRWQDLDLDSDPPLLRVAQACFDEPGGHHRFDEPKAKSTRTVELPKQVVRALKRQRTQLKKDRLAAGSLWRELDLVFPSQVGTPMADRTLRRAFHDAAESAGMSGRHPHELRHTWVTTCSNAGISLEAIADAAGHSNTNITATVYRHRQMVVGSLTRQVMDDVLTS